MDGPTDGKWTVMMCGKVVKKSESRRSKELTLDAPIGWKWTSLKNIFFLNRSLFSPIFLFDSNDRLAWLHIVYFMYRPLSLMGRFTFGPFTIGRPNFRTKIWYPKNSPRTPNSIFELKLNKKYFKSTVRAAQNRVFRKIVNFKII